MTVTRMGKHGVPYSSAFLKQLRDDLQQLAADVDDTRLAVPLQRAASAVNVIRGMNEEGRDNEGT
jgi:hypothetical protein